MAACFHQSINTSPVKHTRTHTHTQKHTQSHTHSLSLSGLVSLILCTELSRCPPFTYEFIPPLPLLFWIHPPFSHTKHTHTWQQGQVTADTVSPAQHTHTLRHIHRCIRMNIHTNRQDWGRGRWGKKRTSPVALFIHWLTLATITQTHTAFAFYSLWYCFTLFTLSHVCVI